MPLFSLPQATYLTYMFYQSNQCPSAAATITTTIEFVGRGVPQRARAKSRAAHRAPLSESHATAFVTDFSPPSRPYVCRQRYPRPTQTQTSQSVSQSARARTTGSELELDFNYHYHYHHHHICFIVDH